MNSHVARIVHPPDWSHAEMVRKSWPPSTPIAYNVIEFGVPDELASETTVWTLRQMRLHRHAVQCVRCKLEHCVWSPAGHVPRDVDFGACPRCDRWSPPGNLDLTMGISPELIRVGGDPIAWHELSDRSLLEVIRFEVMRLRHYLVPRKHFRASLGDLLRPLFVESFRRNLGFALTEAAYRNLLPKPDDLRVAWDLALADGRARSGDEDTLTLADVWALYWYPMKDRA